MSDLIKREDAIEVIAQQWLCEASAESPYVNDDDIEDYRKLAEKLFEDIPSADAISRVDVTNESENLDVEEVSANAVQGEWIIEDAHTEHCSVCGYAFYTSALFAVGGNDEPNYCPNCGAKMKGGDDE